MSKELNLIEMVKDNSPSMLAEPARVIPNLNSFQNIRAIIFDVYGTLFISGAGDIGLTNFGDHEKAIRKVLLDAGIKINTGGNRISDEFYGLINREHTKQHANNIDHPEVDIREVWQSLVQSFPLKMRKGIAITDLLIERLALMFEILVNPVWPMPDLMKVLTELCRRKIKLGIVSNAQFYTHLLFPAFFGQSFEEVGFDPEYCIWSYQLREAKPSIRLFQKCAMKMEEKDHIQPGEVLYVGNDMLNDIWPATLEGFNSALFAGDRRSLHWREDDRRCQDLKPDIVINSLSQILECV